MAVTINVLNAGNMTLGSSGSTPATRAETRLQWSNDESDYNDYLIEGVLSINSLENFDIYFDGGCDIYKIEIGNAVTSIYPAAFYGCNSLTYMTIPDSVTSIGDEVFFGCSNLTTITVLGKTTTDAQILLANAGVPAGCTIIGELG